MKQDSTALAGRNIHEHAFGEFVQGREVTVRGLYPNWIATDYNRWRTAKPADVKAAMDPLVVDDLQHLRLDALAGVSADELNQVLASMGTLDGEGAAFVEASEEQGVNEAYLIAHAFLETGRGTSELAQGVEVGLSAEDVPVVLTDQNRADVQDVKTVYNMFGIGAADSCPLECGATTAYQNDWKTPGDAIRGGAAWIRSGYIYNDDAQNTLYKMKWNPRMHEGHEWKQYATDVDWAGKQTGLIGEIYEQLEDPNYHYDYPAYRE